MFDVSVIVPVYNVEKYIEKSMTSICSQKNVSYEIILVNDGTVDKSIEMAERVLSHSKVSYKVYSQKNQGLPVARNVGLRHASGKYVVFIDSDDYLNENHLYSLWKLCCEYELTVAHTLFELTFENNRMGKDISMECKDSIVDHEELLYGFMRRQPAIHCCTLMIKRSFLLDNGLLFNENLKFGEDAEFMCRLFLAIDKIGNTNKATYKYLQRNKSIMSFISDINVEVFLREYGYTMNYLRKKYSEYSQVINYTYARNLLGVFHAYCKGASMESCLKIRKKINQQCNMSCLLVFPDFKVRMSTFWFLCCPHVAIMCLRKI